MAQDNWKEPASSLVADAICAFLGGSGWLLGLGFGMFACFHILTPLIVVKCSLYFGAFISLCIICARLSKN